MISTQCLTCKFYTGLQECEAFPEGIPQEIFDGTIDHREPYENDHGIQWEPLNDEAKEIDEELNG